MLTASSPLAARRSTPVDTARRDAFAARLAAGLDPIPTLAVARARDGGLLGAMRDARWRTSSELAQLVRRDERVLVDLLAVLTEARIVEHDVELARYRLPLEHGVVLGG